MDSMLSAQMGQLQLSGTGYASHQHPTQYLPASQYAGGWAVSHTNPSAVAHSQVLVLLGIVQEYRKRWLLNTYSSVISAYFLVRAPFLPALGVNYSHLLQRPYFSLPNLLAHVILGFENQCATKMTIL